MHRLEDRAKPFIEPMLLGRSVTLNKAAIETLAAWVTLKMMVYEATDPTEAVFTRAETLQFAQDERIPPDVRIWLFRTSGPERRAWITRSFAAMSHGAGSTPVKSNVGLTVFIIGRLVVVFAINRVRPLNLKEPTQRRAKRLWPARGARLVWPPLVDIAESDIADMTLALNTFIKSRGVMV
jgi:hypothetical protein